MSYYQENYSKLKKLVNDTLILKELPKEVEIKQNLLARIEKDNKKDYLDVYLAKNSKDVFYFLGLVLNQREGEGFGSFFNLKENLDKYYKDNFLILGGAKVKFNKKDKEILIYDYSINYGYLNKELILKVLNYFYPDFKIKVDSPSGEIIKTEEEFLKLLEKEKNFLNLISCCSLDLFKNSKLINSLIKHQIKDKLNQENFLILIKELSKIDFNKK